jgi:hypothetical protein
MYSPIHYNMEPNTEINHMKTISAYVQTRRWWTTPSTIPLLFKNSPTFINSGISSILKRSEHGNRSSFRKDMFSRFYNIELWARYKTLVIPEYSFTSFAVQLLADSGSWIRTFFCQAPIASKLDSTTLINPVDSPWPFCFQMTSTIWISSLR